MTDKIVVKASQKVKDVGNAIALADGRTIRFDIITADDQAHTFVLSGEHPELLVRYLIATSQDAARRAGTLRAPAGPETRTVYPIEAVSLDVQTGRVPSECLVTIHLGTFPLTFALDANAVYALRDAIAQLVPTGPSRSQ